MMTFDYAQLGNFLTETLVRSAKVIVYNVMKIKNANDVKDKWFHFLEFVQN